MQGLLGTGGHVDRTVRLRNVDTEVEVETQILQAVDLVVDLRIADEALGVGLVALVVEQSHRILVGHGVVVVDRVDRLAVSIGLAVVPPRIAVQSLGIVNGLGRVVLYGLTYGLGVGEAVVHIHALGIEAYREVVVQQRGAEVDRERLAGHVTSFQRTVLIQITERNAIRQVVLLPHLDVARQTDVTLVRLCQLVDLLLPVGVGLTQSAVGIVVGAAHVPRHGLAHLVAGHHVDILRVVAQ